jgi:hypothetical protein
MIIQDIVFMIGSFIFAIALIPAILHKDKPPLKTSLTTFLVLVAFNICYLTLGLYLAFTSGILTAICWLILFLQKLRQNQRRVA